MKTLYQTLATYEGDLEDMLVKLRLMDIFEPIIRSFDASIARKVVRYIAYVYSKDSEHILGKDSWSKNKERAAGNAELPKELWQQVVYLIPKDDSDRIPEHIKGVAIRYLNHQNDRNNRDLKSLYDLYDELIVAAASPALTIDAYENKFKCRKYANEVREWIREAETRALEEDSNMRGAKAELKTKNTHTSIRPEHSAR